MNTTSLRLRATLTLAAALTTFAAFAASLGAPAAAHASIDEPWPEPPSCSNETGTCSTMEDIVAYECYFENPDSPFHFCDDPIEELQMQKEPGLTAPSGSDVEARLASPIIKR